ncbi:Prefoldin subunit 3 [Neolentinus lepideus HHB14362 ss-1]|uniref:Prefoldin subunit 3 n=1 Tax=Neolentinus lepideus HHB14362 ss-1 TaxID=1314782 RepID=A0A165NFQ3_9AGAM|nr:Prefoldin subunit 3 [Neolentinus lepideus HHB14362 ss-1]
MSTDILASVEKNPRGIPKAPFVANVEEYVGGYEADVEPTLRKIQDALAKYRYMDANLQQRRQGLAEKIPDIKKTLAMVEFLRERREGKQKASSEGDDDDDDLDDEDGDGDGKKPLTTTFELNDTLYAEAQLENTDTVYLWLGANVMLSYKLPAAVTLLKSKLDVAESSLQNTTEDLEFLREQITMMEVNTARVYNWDVKRRRDRRAREGVEGKSKSDSG